MNSSSMCIYPYQAFQYAVENTNATDMVAGLRTGIEFVCSYVATRTLLKSDTFQYFNSLGCMVDFPKRVKKVINLGLPLNYTEVDKLTDSLMDCFNLKLVNQPKSSTNIKNWCLNFKALPKISSNVNKSKPAMNESDKKLVISMIFSIYIYSVYFQYINN